MLSEAEWSAVSTRLGVSFLLAKGMDDASGLDPDTQMAAATVWRGYAMDRYQDLTGHRLESPWQLYLVRNADYGPNCASCSKPLRTPSASFCAACGLEASVSRPAVVQA